MKSLSSSSSMRSDLPSPERQSHQDHAAEWVIRFLAQLLKAREAGSLLDPCAGDGTLVTQLSAGMAKAQAWSDDQRARETVLAANRPGLSLVEKAWAATETEAFDAIVSFPPLGARNRRLRMMSSKHVNPWELSDDPGHLLLLDARQALAPGGLMLMRLLPRLLWNKNERGLIPCLASMGYQLSALLHLPSGAFSHTQLAYELALVEKGPAGELFVGEVPKDAKAQLALIQNLLERRPGKRPAQGRLVDWKDYFGLKRLEAAETLQRQVSERGLVRLALSEAVSEIRRIQRSDDETLRILNDADAVFLPAVTQFRASLMNGEPVRGEGYQLIVNPALALPEYLAHYFNVGLGQEVRNSLSAGAAAVPRLSFSQLRDMPLYLPPLPVQQKIVAARHRIAMLQAELHELETRLIDEPHQTSEVLEALARINREDSLSDWHESLPFPLASILRVCDTEDETPKQKYERLLHFFEALAAFAATLLLSGFRRDEDWDKLRTRLSASLDKHHLRLDRPTFGVWKLIVQNLGKEARNRLAGDQNARIDCLDRFCLTESGPLDALGHSRFFSLLDEANNARNRWTGHGGAVGEQEASNRHGQCLKMLESFREIFGTAFLKWQLIEPDKPEIKQGVFHYRPRRVMGTNPILERMPIEVSDGLDTGVLYCYSPGHSKAMRVEPLFQVLNAPQPACYFLNRFEKQQLHYVSYHFAGEPQSTDPASTEALTALLDDFRKSAAGEEST